MTKQLVISLGSSCDGASQLEKKGVNNIHYFLILYGMNMTD